MRERSDVSGRSGVDPNGEMLRCQREREQWGEEVRALLTMVFVVAVFLATFYVIFTSWSE